MENLKTKITDSEIQLSPIKTLFSCSVKIFLVGVEVTLDETAYMFCSLSKPESMTQEQTKGQNRCLR